MTTANTIEANHSDLTIFIEELTSSSGVRAVSAWQALSKQDAAYALEDEEAPYEFRHAVGSDIGWEAAQMGLDPNGDIPQYVVYMHLHETYGIDWPKAALTDYLRTFENMGELEARVTARLVWEKIKARYSNFKFADGKPTVRAA
ncbi:hypothetical protein DY974_11520 [Pseudomonas aeruginosa]|uniref:hypothetical protein n=1 Tax=Pseudomonas aeruginosa TaxID=287 RepID=UPI000F545427|nr:hypothetical protein [Pseudomonas aeruginosa]MCS7757854.1 hypothetical protein [Pseudomonas aeruginosa]MCT0625737.1 hypothetical protein [Pseudomonas aeruginosa]MCT0667245.1 hypothetical protein [Pseudomonas aeruginosa]RQC58256.1 hypothetical protein IPC358_16660 [Pseudomonas aeruginosa]RTU29460.1 hypothetical protein DY974_11520 [Pseudomonas aeruginosa]